MKFTGLGIGVASNDLPLSRLISGLVINEWRDPKQRGIGGGGKAN